VKRDFAAGLGENGSLLDVNITKTILGSLLHFDGNVSSPLPLSFHRKGKPRFIDNRVQISLVPQRLSDTFSDFGLKVCLLLNQANDPLEG